MAIRSVILRGYGNGTFNGTIAKVMIRGYIADAAVEEPPKRDAPGKRHITARYFTRSRGL